MPASTGDPATNGSGPGPHIGAEDIATPPWAEGYESASKVGALAMTRAAPRLVAQAARWSWQASPRLTLLSVLVQLAAGLVTAFGLWPPRTCSPGCSPRAP